MLAIILIFLVLLRISACDVKYITVYGRVLVGNATSTSITDSYEDCMELCAAETYCVLAYGSKSCSLYNYGNIKSVLKLDTSTAGAEDYVTFRIEANFSTCPSDINPPTFNNYPAIGYYITQAVTLYYRIDYLNSVWTYGTLAQNTTLTCTGDFIPSQRKYGLVCLRSIGNIVKANDTFDTIAADCANYGGSLGGFESEDELYSFNSSLTKTDTMILNGKMTAECRQTGNCDGIWLDSLMFPPCNIPFYEGYPTADGDCLAIRKFSNSSFGLINLSCTMADTDIFNARKLCIKRPP